MIFTQESEEFVKALKESLQIQADFLEPVIVQQMKDFNIINKEAEVLDIGIGSGHLLCKLASHFGFFPNNGGTLTLNNIKL